MGTKIHPILVKPTRTAVKGRVIKIIASRDGGGPPPCMIGKATEAGPTAWDLAPADSSVKAPAEALQASGGYFSEQQEKADILRRRIPL